MKYLRFLCLGSALLLLAGCSSYQGGTPDTYQSTTGSGSSPGQTYPQPTASPTFRPGMNPDDPRDPHFNTRPQPWQSPPATPQ